MGFCKGGASRITDDMLAPPFFCISGNPCTGISGTGIPVQGSLPETLKIIVLAIRNNIRANADFPSPKNADFPLRELFRRGKYKFVFLENIKKFRRGKFFNSRRGKSAFFFENIKKFRREKSVIRSSFMGVDLISGEF